MTMIDNDSEYKALKELCRNEIYQFTQPIGNPHKGCDKPPKTIAVPHWVFSEEYVLTKKDFKLRWHTYGVIDGGLFFDADIADGELRMKTIRDGIVEMGSPDHQSLKLERYRNRMIAIKVDADAIYDVHTDGGSGKIHVSFFDDPKYVLWTVQYFDYIANEERFVMVRARSKNEAKVIAWQNSCYSRHNIEPDHYKAYKYYPYVITQASETVSADVMATQKLICDNYDKENDEVDEEDND